VRVLAERGPPAWAWACASGREHRPALGVGRGAGFARRLRPSSRSGLRLDTDCAPPRRLPGLGRTDVEHVNAIGHPAGRNVYRLRRGRAGGLHPNARRRVESRPRRHDPVSRDAGPLTIAVEVAIALLIIPRALWRRRISDVVLVNLASHPLATLAVRDFAVTWIVAELLVTAGESVIYRYLSHFSWSRAILLSVACNSMTAALSFVV
jgi:hypothetical protein